MRIIGIIPARWGSTRFPGKPLARLKNRPVIEHVWRRASRAKLFSRLLVATDDQRIFDAVLGFGGEAVMTPVTCHSGTDRLARVAKRIACDLVVNIQGDEPFIREDYLQSLVAPFRHERGLQMTTLAAPLPPAELKNPNAVKVVCTHTGHALYFSRAPIPWAREKLLAEPLLHLGVYAFRRKFLLQYNAWRPTPLEQTEQLEQLRALEHGVRIRVVRVKKPLLSVDTPSDLRQAEKMLRR